MGHGRNRERLTLGRDRARYAHAAVSLTGVAPYRDRDAAAFFHTVHTCADAQMMITILTGTLFTKQGEPLKAGLVLDSHTRPPCRHLRLVRYGV